MDNKKPPTKTKFDDKDGVPTIAKPSPKDLLLKAAENRSKPSAGVEGEKNVDHQPSPVMFRTVIGNSSQSHPLMAKLNKLISDSANLDFAGFVGKLRELNRQEMSQARNDNAPKPMGFIEAVSQVKDLRNTFEAFINKFDEQKINEFLAQEYVDHYKSRVYAMANTEIGYTNPLAAKASDESANHGSNLLMALSVLPAKMVEQSAPFAIGDVKTYGEFKSELAKQDPMPFSKDVRNTEIEKITTAMDNIREDNPIKAYVEKNYSPGAEATAKLKR